MITIAVAPFPVDSHKLFPFVGSDEFAIDIANFHLNPKIAPVRTAALYCHQHVPVLIEGLQRSMLEDEKADGALVAMSVTKYRSQQLRADVTKPFPNSVFTTLQSLP
jgi:hypothetical protein